MTQNDRILMHLTKYRSITPREAFNFYGCQRLGARIYDLKRMGYDIKKEWVNDFNRFGEPVRFAKYTLEDEAA